MIDARVVLLAAATLLGWLSLTLAASVSTLPPEVAALAALLSLVAWVPGWSAAGVVVVVTVIALLASGSGSPGATVVAPVCGVALLLAVVLLDLADYAAGASSAAVRQALGRLVPGLATGAAAGVAVASAGQLAAAQPVGTMAVLAPWLLLVAALAALGLHTRRGFWSLLVPSRRLSPTTKRYLERARRTADSDG